MQSRFCAITAVLLVCGAHGLHLAEGPAPEHIGPNGENLDNPLMKYYIDNKAKIWTNIFTAQAKYFDVHDLHVVATADMDSDRVPKLEQCPGLATMAAQAKMIEKRGTKAQKNAIGHDFRAAWIALLGGLDTYSSFEEVWTKRVGEPKVSHEAYGTALKSLLDAEGEIAGFPATTFNTTTTDALARLTDENHDGHVTKFEASRFFSCLKSSGCKMAYPRGGTIPKRACEPAKEGASADEKRLAGTWLKIDEWMGQD